MERYQAKEGGRNSVGKTRETGILYYWWKCTPVPVTERSAQAPAGGSGALLPVFQTHSLSLAHINRDLVPHRFLSALLLLRVSGQPRSSFEYILSLSPNQWSFSSSASWMPPLPAFHMYHDVVPLKMTNTVRFRTAISLSLVSSTFTMSGTHEGTQEVSEKWMFTSSFAKSDKLMTNWL